MIISNLLSQKLCKRIITSFATLLAIIILSNGSLRAQTSVTLRVDMSAETVADPGVHIAGNFQDAAGLGNDWSPASTQVFDADGDNIYEITVELPAGTYQYKFINGNAWGQDENPPADCSVGDTNNREFTVGATDLELPAVPFNGCIGRVRFAVNMGDVAVDPTGVFLVGDFQEAAGYADNWDPASIPLQDVNADGTWSVELTIPEGEYRYLFVNGNSLDGLETVPGDCSIPGDVGGSNRFFTIGETNPDLPIFCFASCQECDPAIATDYDTYWWNDAVFYQMFVRSFNDSDGDGVGDFQGAIQRLDYLNDGDPETNTDLGVTAIWLMPMMESPSYHGYDVTDYYAVEPDYGSMEDFQDFLDAAHARGIKVIIDLVLNHSSSQHPWFNQSAAGSAEFRDWYIWSEDNPAFPGPWGQNVWHQNSGEYFYGLFWSGMPDLNYENPDVKAEMFNVADFWLDLGVDGYRLDAIKYLIEDGTVLENTPETFALLEEFNDVYHAANPDVFSIGEVWSSTPSIIPYVQNDRLDACFDFDLAGDIQGAVNSGNPTAIRQQIDEIRASYPALQYGTFLTNHDMDRVFNNLGSDESKMKLAAAIYLTLPGVPFVYYGEELGMLGTGDHRNIRRPMQWSDAANAGFSSATPWYGLGPNFLTNNVAMLASDPGSILSQYKRYIHLRNEQPSLRKGNYLDVSSNDEQLLTFARVHQQEAALVLSNFSNEGIESPSVSLSASTLSAGEYFLTDLLNNESLGTITINENGGFSDHQLELSLGGRENLVVLISEETAVNNREQVVLENSFQLFPNPSGGLVHLQSESLLSGQLSVISSGGQVVYSARMNGPVHQFDTNDWPSGVYFVLLRANGELQRHKLVVR
ncbi:hypothetical protein CEQ90_00945 [Lewinellaceae bacterium SD302]|nr:hypothetical protein CEQ90_00945 [Lewinellaceae bacterium SD302]